MQLYSLANHTIYLSILYYIGYFVPYIGYFVFTYIATLFYTHSQISPQKFTRYFVGTLALQLNISCLFNHYFRICTLDANTVFHSMLYILRWYYPWWPPATCRPWWTCSWSTWPWQTSWFSPSVHLFPYYRSTFYLFFSCICSKKPQFLPLSKIGEHSNIT